MWFWITPLVLGVGIAFLTILSYPTRMPIPMGGPAFLAAAVGYVVFVVIPSVSK